MRMESDSTKLRLFTNPKLQRLDWILYETTNPRENFFDKEYSKE